MDEREREIITSYGYTVYLSFCVAICLFKGTWWNLMT